MHLEAERGLVVVDGSFAAELRVVGLADVVGAVAAQTSEGGEGQARAVLLAELEVETARVGLVGLGYRPEILEELFRLRLLDARLGVDSL